MKLSDLRFEYPESLVAQKPALRSRILLNTASLSGPLQPQEISKKDLLNLFQAGDVLVINDTKVEKRRVFGRSAEAHTELEILFIEQLSDLEWLVLFPASRLKKQESVLLPDDIHFTLLESGIPQKIKLSQKLSEHYFEAHGELPLPPYIQKARTQRHTVLEDAHWYQTDWADCSGSQAAPTASFHFKKSDLEQLQSQGVLIEKVTLHVGLGTFLPLKTENLEEHKMHSEWCSISKKSYSTILQQKQKGFRIWALGTTVTRTLESCALGLLQENETTWSGSTQLFIRGTTYSFQIVTALLTNFHQPETTLLALVATFAGLENVKKTYQYAIQNQFRLFSYGDLTVWLK